MKRRFFVIPMLFFGFSTAHAATLHGLATVHIQNKRTTLELTQIVTVSESQAEFVNLDDWGSTSFSVKFEKNKLRFDSSAGTVTTSLKNALSLPLKQQEFLEILHYSQAPVADVWSVVPSDEKACTCIPKQNNCAITANAKALPQSVVWRHKKRKNLEILFTDFVTLKSGKNVPENYPKSIRIAYKKNVFDFKWQKLQRND